MILSIATESPPLTTLFALRGGHHLAINAILIVLVVAAAAAASSPPCVELSFLSYRSSVATLIQALVRQEARRQQQQQQQKPLSPKQVRVG